MTRPAVATSFPVVVEAAGTRALRHRVTIEKTTDLLHTDQEKRTGATTARWPRDVSTDQIFNNA